MLVSNNIIIADNDYLKTVITDFFNLIVNNTVVLDGNKPLERNIFKDIESIQYQALNNTVYIQTQTYNYVLSEQDGKLRLCEFYKRAEDINKK